MSSPQPATPSPLRPMVKRKKPEMTLFHKNLKPVQGKPPQPAQVQKLRKQVSSPNAKLAAAAAAGARSTGSPTPPPGGESTPSPSSSQSQSQSQPAVSAPSPTPDAPPADLPYQEYKLVSCARHGWRYDVMKFESRRHVDIAAWQRPVKLNRKEPRREGAVTEGVLTAGAPVPAGPMVGPDGKPVIGADGRVVMLDAEGKPIHDLARGGPKPKDDKDKGKKKKFQKKIKQVYFVPEHVRQLRREERYPWVIEDQSQTEVWVGRMEDATKSETHALFMPAADNVFRFVPAHRWYKFQKQRPQRHVISLEEAEKLMAQKAEKQNRWMMRLRDGASSSRSVPSSGTGLRPMIVRDAGGSGLFSDDEDEDGSGARRRGAREQGQEGDADEVEYESDVADDEEINVQQGMEDEVAKEIEERLKREYRKAEAEQKGEVDEDEDEEGEQLTSAGKAMKKLVRRYEKNDAYDSDKEENPYASSDDEDQDEEEPPQLATGPAVLQDQNTSRSSSQTPANKLLSPDKGKSPSRRTPSKANSRSGSPAPGTPLVIKTEVKQESLGGHSVVAKRATSPRLPIAPKLKQNGSRASSPLAGSGSRAGSPVPPAGPSGGKPAKRKADDAAGSGGAVNGTANANGQPKTKKRKASAATAAGAAAGSSAAKPTVAPGTDLTPGLLIRWLRETPNATTRDCIQYFQPCLAEDAKKARFTALMKSLVTMKEGVLLLKAPYMVGDPDRIVVQE